MNLVLLRPGIALISIIAGMCILSISIFLSQGFMEYGFLRKRFLRRRYPQVVDRIFVALIGAFFILGGLAFLLTK